MKKLIMFVMVFCIAGSAYGLPDPDYLYGLGGDTKDAMGNGPDGTLIGNATFVNDPEMGDVLELDGTGDWVEIADGLIDFVVAGSFQSFTIGAWVKTPAPAGQDCAGAMYFKGTQGEPGEDWESGEKMFYIDTDVCGEGGNDNTASFVGWGCDWVRGDETIAGDDTWHHVAVVVDGTAETGAVYIDGVDTTDADELNFDDPPSDREADICYIGHGELHGEESFTGRIAIVALFQSALSPSEVEELRDYRVSGPVNPLLVDPNLIVVYEEGETEGNFEISLKFPPLGQGYLAPDPNNQGDELTVNIIVDPNGFDGGTSADIKLIGGSGDHDRITFTKTTETATDPCDPTTCPDYVSPSNPGTCWNNPVTIRFRAKEDELAEKPELEEAQNIVVWAEPTTNEPNWSRPVAQVIVGGTVWDNDQANILFAYTAWQTSNPKIPIQPGSGTTVQIWEEPGGPYNQTRWRKIGVKLQVPPKNSEDPCIPCEVKLQAEITGDLPPANNWPLTDPCLPFEEIDEPNGLIFDKDNYDVYQMIKIWGNDDEFLQVEATAEGGQNYPVGLTVSVADGGGDERYQWEEEILDADDEPTGEYDTVGIESELPINIEDNECGAFGLLPMDVGNPDPNDVDSLGNPNPDCYVNIHDALEVALRWLKCTHPQKVGCIDLNPAE